MNARKAIVSQLNNPFHPDRDREIEAIDPGITVWDYVNQHPEVMDFPVVCVLNGKPLMRDSWDTVIEGEYVVVFSRLPGKSLFKAVLGVALVGVAIMNPLGWAALATWGAGIAGAALIYNSGLLKGLFDIPEPEKQHQLAAPSPTYTLTAQGNTARLGQAIPVVYGRVNMYPDFIEQPFSRFDQDDQFLYHRLMVSQGDVRIEDVFIEDTKATNFNTNGSNNIQFEIVSESSGAQSLFRSNVVTAVEVAGQELEHDVEIGPFTVNPAGTKIDKIELDFVFPRGLWSGSNFASTAVDLEISIRAIDDDDQTIPTDYFEVASWDRFSSIATATAKKTAAKGVWVKCGDSDKVKFEGNGHNKTKRQTYRIGGFKKVEGQANQYHIFGDFRDPLLSFTSGRYQVKVKRLTADDTSTDKATAVQWQGMKGFYKNELTYQGVTQLALSMKSTNTLSSTSSRKINVIAHRRLRAWIKGYGWSTPTETSSIVWALADLLTNTEYGLGIPDDMIDLDSFADMDKIFDSRGDEYNGVFDRKMGAWDAIGQICKVGRCAPVLRNGLFKIIRDRRQTLPTAMFSASNIVKDSFNMNFTMRTEDSADGVEVEYTDPKTWKPDTIAVTATGTEPTNPAKIKLVGCAHPDHALREALYLARNNAYRRKTIKITTEMEGYIPMFGDLVSVSHPMMDYGQSGEVIDVASRTSDYTLSVAPDWEASGKHYIVFRNKDGSAIGPLEVTKGVSDNQVRFTGSTQRWTRLSQGYRDYAVDGDETFRLYFGSEYERTSYAFGTIRDFSRYCVVRSIHPRGEGKVELELLIEDERVHED